MGRLRGSASRSGTRRRTRARRERDRVWPGMEPAPSPREAELADWLAFCHQLVRGRSDCAAAFRTDSRCGARPTARSSPPPTSVERAIRERIAVDTRPWAGRRGIRRGRAGSGGERWYIDPIDGTHNFLRGVPIFGTLLAVERDGEIQVGMISSPALGQRWWATRGGGALGPRRTGEPPEPRRLAVSPRLDRSQILFRSIRDMEASGSRPARSAQSPELAGARIGDCWGYTLVADGVAEAMLEQDLHPWDLAPWTLVEEAGGRITDFNGHRPSRARGGVCDERWAP